MPQRGLSDQRVTIRPVVATAGEQPHALAFTLDDQAVTVVLYFVKSIRAGGDFGAAHGNARLVLVTQHTD